MIIETMFQGFAPYIEMFDSGEIEPGQTIVVGVCHYTVLPFDPKDKHPVYRVEGSFETKHNIRNLLKNEEWSIKGDSPE